MFRLFGLNWPAGLTAFVVGVCCVSSSPAVEPDLLKQLDDQHALGIDFWIYNDLEQAFEDAKRLNKPIFVTFRCVPCQACSGFDADVAKGTDNVDKLAREKFIPVRQVEMKGVDLSLFEFDYDLNWAAMFVNADGTVYARYGTQSAEGPDAYNSIKGLENTMHRVLELHKNYPANKEALRGKKPRPKSYTQPLEMAGMMNKDKLRQQTTRRNCIHCHMIHDAQHHAAQSSGDFSHDMLWRYPLPDNIGLTIDPVSGVEIEKVAKGSPADQAGFKPGMKVTSMQGQPICSIADMQWVLHHMPNENATLKVTTDKVGTKELALQAGWKQSDISWRGSLWSVSPKLRVWTPPLEEEKQKQLGIPADLTPLLVKWINTGSEAGKAAKASGLKHGDVIVALADQPLNMTPQKFNLHIKLNYAVGDELPLTVLRDGKRKKLRIKLVE